MVSDLLNKFPGLARYENVQDPESCTEPREEINFSAVFIDALNKTYDMACRKYCCAFTGDISFLEWARVNLSTDYIDYQNREIAVNELWRSKAPLERFREALREWARSYLALARLCHLAVIAETNDSLRRSVDGLG